MTTFRFEALRADGALVRGRIEAAGRASALDQLGRRGLTPVRVRPGARARRRANLDELAVFFRGLSSLVEAGLTLDAALAVAAREGSMAGFSAAVRAHLAEGDSFAGAVRRSGDVPGVVGALLRSGERHGLAFALEQAAVQLERDSHTRRDLRAALTYPAVLAAVGAGSIGVLMTAVLPRFVTLLEDVGAPVPWLAQSVMGAREALSASWVPLLVLALAAVVILRKVGQRPMAAEVLLRTPVIGRIRERFATARAARVLGALLGLGVPTLDALRIAGEASGDRAIEARMQRAEAQVTTGASLAMAIRMERALNPTTLDLLAAGERAGRASEMLTRAADLSEIEGRRRLQTALRLVEPLMILGIGAVVAVAALTLLQAVYGIRLT